MDQTDHDALAGFINNAAGGSFTVQYGRNQTAPASFSNAGTLTVGEGSTFTVTGAYTQTAGMTVLSAGTLTGSTGVTIQLGSSLTGSGTINANVQNAGDFAVGGNGTTGILTIKGNYTQTSTGILDLAIAGLSPGIQFDQLNITGMATLDGTLNVALLNGFIANAGDSFQVLLFAGKSGNFATMNGLDLGGGLYFDPVFDSTSLTLVTKTN